MDPVLASLMGTVIGGFFGIVGGILTGRRQAKLEKEKWLQTRADDIAKETRLALAELTRKMAAAVQAMLWFTMKASNTPDKLTRDDISSYDKEIQELLPHILGSVMVVSALEKEISEQMAALVSRTYEVVLQIADATKEFEASRESSAKALGELTWSVIGLQDELYKSISGITGLTNLGSRPITRSE